MIAQARRTSTAGVPRVGGLLGVWLGALMTLGPGAGSARAQASTDEVQESGAALATPPPPEVPETAAPSRPQPVPPPPRAPEAEGAVESAHDLGVPPPSRRREPKAPEDRAVEEPEAESEPWQGPRVELGYARYRFSDGHEGGGVDAFHFGGYLPTGPVRLGMYGELALRDYSLGASSDAIVRATVLAGYQHRGLGPFLPYGAVVGTGGVLFGKRFHTPVSHTLWGAGLEIGADVNIVKRLWAGASFSWIRITMNGLRFDLLMFRLRVGL